MRTKTTVLMLVLGLTIAGGSALAKNGRARHLVPLGKEKRIGNGSGNVETGETEEKLTETPRPTPNANNGFFSPDGEPVATETPEIQYGREVTAPTPKPKIAPKPKVTPKAKR